MINKILSKIKIILFRPKTSLHYSQANVQIDKNVSIGKNVTLYKTALIQIGGHTMIASNVIIHTSTHDYDMHPMWLKRIDRPVWIGKHVWIGTGAIILPGVKIGNYAVVGAGSVVTAHVPDGAIVAGNPARIIKYRDVESIEKIKNIPDYPKQSTVTKETYLDDTKICKLINNNYEQKN